MSPKSRRRITRKPKLKQDRRRLPTIGKRHTEKTKKRPLRRTDAES